MARVHRLPDDLANQIAAGEVVERPASVVKELLENSLDAGATRVRVDVEGGGVQLLRITDDGCGMDEVDARLAVERHATSKINSIDDLLALHTFGFRGEALPSIASVSRFVLKTRRREAEEGIELRIEGGAPPQVKPCGLAPGTVIEVRDLFYNVPARRKFLKATATESAHITDAVEAMALAAPQLSITLSRDGRVAREWLKQATRGDRAREALDGEELAEMGGVRGPVEVLALLGRPERARATGAALRLFVNGRLVRDRALQRTVSQAYGSTIEPGRYPVGVVYLEIAPDRVDVNVHPQKAEVRFSDGRAVADALFKVLSLELGKAFGLPPAGKPYATPFPAANVAAARALAQQSSANQPALWSTPPAHSSSDAPTVSRPVVHGPAMTPAPPAVTPLPPSATPQPPAAEPDPWQLGPEPPTAQSPRPPLVATPSPPPPPVITHDQREPFAQLRFVAQSKQTYLLCEGREGLYVLDQHAAAERVTFHRLKRAFESRSVALQPLLFPIMVEVLAEEAALVEEQHDALLSAGMDVRVVGPRTVAVHAVPQLLKSASPERLLRDLLAEASRGGHAAFSDAIDLALATMACHGSVRAGDRMTESEVTALLTALDSVDFAGHCPHGRPVVTVLRWAELERKVGRR